jgi:hypothetical protein
MLCDVIGLQRRDNPAVPDSAFCTCVTLCRRATATSPYALRPPKLILRHCTAQRRVLSVIRKRSFLSSSPA